jgi:hypothetical protein
MDSQLFLLREVSRDVAEAMSMNMNLLEELEDRFNNQAAISR